ncbi:MAG TPA: DUF3048 domain-containing protein [Euzebya sp.]|nr:DUF3048 domain-containing protein [Euzebya sp.]
MALPAACTGAAPDVVPTTEPVVTIVPVPTIAPAPPTATATEEEATYPLTGEPADDTARLDLPALGVKIDNAAAARPQLGLAQADIVIEELVEGGVTRFLAIFHSNDPGEAGPVRSGRDVDADLFPPFQGILAISGAAAPTYNVLFSAGLTVFEEGQAGGAIYRVGDRPAPHNLNALTDRLWQAGADQPAAVEPWPFDREVPDGGTDVEAFVAPFSDDYTHSWAWRAQDDLFERGQNGTRHLTAEGHQLAAENIIYASVQIGSGGGVDVSGTSTVSMDLISGGPATFFRDGQMFTGTWRKTSRDAQFEWLDTDGRPFPLAPGRTWVELQPSGLGIDTDPLPNAVDADAPTEEPTEE